MTVYEDCMNQIVTDIDALGFTTLRNNDVKKRSWPWDRHRVFQGISVHFPFNQNEQEVAGTVSCDDIVYPVMVTVIRGTGGREQDNITRLTDWREKIRLKFINQRLSGVTSVYTMKVRFGRILLPKKWRDNYQATTMAILCYSRESRGGV
mgnify:CR=1 FL=1